MNKTSWKYGKRYELSADGKGLLRWFKVKRHYEFWHIHSKEMTSLERWKYRAMVHLAAPQKDSGAFARFCRMASTH